MVYIRSLSRSLRCMILFNVRLQSKKRTPQRRYFASFLSTRAQASFVPDHISNVDESVSKIQIPPQRTGASDDCKVLQRNEGTVWNDIVVPTRISVKQGKAGPGEAPTIDIEWLDHSFQFPLFYLRDSCKCATCYHAETKQRLLDTFSLSIGIIFRSIQREAKGFRVIWDSGHESFFTWQWLYHHSARERGFSRNRQLADVKGHLQSIKYFDSTIRHDPPSVDYEEVMKSDEGVRVWTAKIQEHGFCFVDGCPPTPKATEALLRRIAFIRETHYGGFWDFTSDLSSKDTAYTSIALGAHTDNTYFKDPSGLQMFHMLSHEKGSGGESLLVDGYRAYRMVRDNYLNPTKPAKSEPSGFRQKIFSHASGNDDVQLRTEYQIISGLIPANGSDLQPDSNFGAIRWNNDDRASLDDLAVHQIESWYEAARAFNDVIKDESSEYWTKLKPGRPLIFNNQRVLHGRAAFTGKRRLCGGYINMDDFLSRWRTLNFRREDLLQFV